MQDMMEMECNILTVLDFNIVVPTARHLSELFLHRSPPSRLVAWSFGRENQNSALAQGRPQPALREGGVLLAARMKWREKCKRLSRLLNIGEQ